MVLVRRFIERLAALPKISLYLNAGSLAEARDHHFQCPVYPTQALQHRTILISDVEAVLSPGGDIVLVVVGIDTVVRVKVVEIHVARAWYPEGLLNQALDHPLQIVVSLSRGHQSIELHPIFDLGNEWQIEDANHVAGLRVLPRRSLLRTRVGQATRVAL